MLSSLRKSGLCTLPCYRLDFCKSNRIFLPQAPFLAVIVLICIKWPKLPILRKPYTFPSYSRQFCLICILQRRAQKFKNFYLERGHMNSQTCNRFGKKKLMVLLYVTLTELDKTSKTRYVHKDLFLFKKKVVIKGIAWQKTDYVIGVWVRISPQGYVVYDPTIGQKG